MTETDIIDIHGEHDMLIAEETFNEIKNEFVEVRRSE